PRRERLPVRVHRRPHRPGGPGEPRRRGVGRHAWPRRHRRRGRLLLQGLPDLMDRTLSGRLLMEAATSMRRRRLAGAILRTVGPVLPKVTPPDRPVFILGSPRSGTTLLFEVLGTSPQLASLRV